MGCPCTVKTVRTDTFAMDYCVFGAGERTMLILPGMSVQSVMKNADAVAEAYACFSATHTVYLLDRVREMPLRYTVEDMAHDTILAMQALGLRDADVFGASQGGMIALRMAISEPSMVHRLVLGSTLARQNKVSIETFDRWASLADRGDASALNRDFVSRAYCEETQAAFRGYFASVESAGTPEELRRFAVLSRACREFDCFDALDRIQCPVLVLGAGEDRVLTGTASAELSKALRCDCFLYDRFGHAVYDEAPDYKERILNFFVGTV